MVAERVGYTRSSNRIVFRGLADHELSFSLRDLIDFGPTQVALLEVGCNATRFALERAHVFGLLPQGIWQWYHPDERYPLATFTSLERRRDSVLLHEQSGLVLQVRPATGGVLAAYQAGAGPEYEVDGRIITFKCGKSISLPDEINETLDCGEAIVLCTDGLEMNGDNVLAVSRDGRVLWDRLASKAEGPCVSLRREGDQLSIRRWSGWCVQVDPMTGHILDERHGL